MDKSVLPEEASGNKPLICLYKFAALLNRYDKREASLALTLRGLLEIFPNAMRSPGLAGIRILLPPVSYETPGYAPSRWSLRHELEAFGEAVGSLEVSYSKDVGEDFRGPFTADEVMLFSYISDRISRIIERLRTRKQLQDEGMALRESNIALSEVLKRIRSEQSETGRAIQDNVSRVVVPMLSGLLLQCSEKQGVLISAAISSLNEITSPFASKLSLEFMSLTPRELVICSLIKQGLSSKEMAGAAGISFATVNNHRESIRKKLNLTNRRVNLRTYLVNNFDSARPAG